GAGAGVFEQDFQIGRCVAANAPAVDINANRFAEIDQFRAQPHSGPFGCGPRTQAVVIVFAALDHCGPGIAAGPITWHHGARESAAFGPPEEVVSVAHRAAGKGSGPLAFVPWEPVELVLNLVVKGLVASPV